MISILSALLLASFAPASVIGDDDTIAVADGALNIPEPARSAARATGIMVPAGCTVTHIGNGFVITAGHCFNAGPEVSRDLSCEGVQIAWAVFASARTSMISRCVKVLAMQTRLGLDWAIFRVDRAPAAWVAISPTPARIGDPLTLFSHPGSRPMRWNRRCRVERPIPYPIGAQALYHRCDTNPGSSGAALLDARTGAIVGIHSGGDARMNDATHVGLIPLLR